MKTIWNKLSKAERTILACIIYYAIGMLLSSCTSYENPVFVVFEVGQCHDNGLCMYKSIQDNGVLTYCGKYEIGDTIPNVANYVMK